MLMIDSVELVLLHELQKVRELESENSSRLEEQLHSRNEVAEIGNLGKNIIADQQVRLLSLTREFRSQLFAKELYKCRDLLFLSNLRNISGRLNTQDRNVVLHEILQEIAIIAGKF